MKNTLVNFFKLFKSKTIWIIIGLEILALEPYIPQLSAFLPENLAVIGSVVLPMLILAAKIARDRGLLNTNATKEEEIDNNNNDTTV